MNATAMTVRRSFVSSSLPYLSTVLMILVTTAIGKALYPALDLTSVCLLYLLPVLISAVRWGVAPSLSASFLGVLCFDYFFVPPVLSLTVADVGHLLNFALFIVVAVVTATLAARLREQAESSRQRERRTAALYSLSDKIAAETDIEQVLQAVAETIAGNMSLHVAILMPSAPYNVLRLIAKAGHDEFALDQKEKAVAQWALEHAHWARGGEDPRAAGHGSLFLPICHGHTSLAILALRFGPGPAPSAEQRKDIEAFANLTALAITRMQLAKEAEQAKWLAESEKLHRALLNAVSHDLRTPLSSITGAVTELLSEGGVHSAETRQTLLVTIREGAHRMNRFVTNLLDMARLESGILKPSREWCDIIDILGVALEEVRDILPDQRLVLDVPTELPLVEADFGLIEQVLISRRDSAVKYSPPEGMISVTVGTTGEELRLSIEDQAPPIAEADRDRVFDKFYRLRSSMHVTGSGLGLSICRGIIDAHGGRIWVEPGRATGNSFVLALPLSRQGQPRVPSWEEKDG